jgi:hypothetical protein
VIETGFGGFYLGASRGNPSPLACDGIRMLWVMEARAADGTPTIDSRQKRSHGFSCRQEPTDARPNEGCDSALSFPRRVPWYREGELRTHRQRGRRCIFDHAAACQHKATAHAPGVPSGFPRRRHGQRASAFSKVTADKSRGRATRFSSRRAWDSCINGGGKARCPWHPFERGHMQSPACAFVSQPHPPPVVLPFASG